MSRLDDLIEEICRRPTEMRYRDVCRILEGFGWTMREQRSGTSHVTFVKAGERTIFTVSTRHGKMVPEYQLNKIRKLLGLE